MGRSFGFMSIIGAISLSGMMIKNGIVLLDEINYQIDVKKRDAYEAIIDSAATRIRPVGLAAVTTVFGMLPLVTDPLFGDMAVTIVFGLTVATVLTLFGVPLFYVVAYNVKK
jgi:multidrug efflux pump subunit AcrB